MLRRLSIGLVAYAIAIAPLPSRAQETNSPILLKASAGAEKPFDSVDDVMRFCRSSIKREMACDVLSAVIGQTTSLSLICFLSTNGDISEETKDKYWKMFKQFDADEFLKIDIAPGVISTVKKANPGCFK
jgi:hypothetical protein